MSKFCNNCGTAMEDEVLVCPNCGAQDAPVIEETPVETLWRLLLKLPWRLPLTTRKP